VFKRLFWLTVGVTLGSTSSFWLMRKVRRTVERFAPERLTHDVVTGARSFGAELLAAVDEGRSGMRQREAELRAELERRQASRHQP
jgi:hypothetical protein